jgi:hypothetical protein
VELEDTVNGTGVDLVLKYLNPWGTKMDLGHLSSDE